MPRHSAPPALLRPGQPAHVLRQLPKEHSRFNEEFLQDLLAQHPELLPASAIRSDVGPLLCIGREVSLPCGTVDNLYLSTGGYPVLVETKLWRNPEARREVLSQTLDYIKDLARKDFEWLQEQWNLWRKGSDDAEKSLIQGIEKIADEEIDEHEFVDRVNRALARGDLLAMIVGDGIETRLQELVDHLCKETAHLRYALTLCELSFFELGSDPSDGLLVVPRIVSNIEPVERAYVRVDVAPELAGKVNVVPVRVDPIVNPKLKSSRTPLSEEQFYATIESGAGTDTRRRIESAIQDLCESFGLEPDFKESAVMLKLPDPNDEALGASLLAFHKTGRVYNTGHMPGQLGRWETIGPESAKQICREYWNRLHAIDSRFPIVGANHNSDRTFLPFSSLAETWPNIRDLIGQTAEEIRKTAMA
jgi:hypothetical protein